MTSARRIFSLIFFVVWAFGGERAVAQGNGQPSSSAVAAPQAGQAFVIPGLDLEMAPVAAGRFAMGSPYSESGRNSDEVLHLVTLTRPFWLGRTPVTQAQYEALIGKNPARFKGTDFPVESVSWEEAMTFCRKLTERERAAGRLPEGYVYTLPTEAQREYACRAGTGGPYAGQLSAIAWFSSNSDEQPHAVAKKQPNAWGFYDMQGTIWEWCFDWYGSYPEEKVTDPTGPERGTSRVYRGGAWFHSADLCRSAYRYKMAPDERGSLLGFRVALSAVR
jgi:formylglycine-generating enzyme required for sulfatase activity